MLQRFPVIVGPTAGGKSQLAMALAARLEATGHGPAEIVSMDSMQVYRGMDIGTAKPTPAERAQVVHHLIDIVEPNQAFTVEHWLGLAERTITDIRMRSGTPIVVGGTHLYAKALLEGLFEGPGPDPALRAELEGWSIAQLRAELDRIDPAAAARIHPNDRRRTVRAIEVHRQTGKPISQLQSQWDQGQRRNDALLVILDWPAEAINPRINARVREMMAAGLLEEVRRLVPAMGPQAREALGYKQLLAHLAGVVPLDDAVESIKIETRRFAKAQRTWLRRLGAAGCTERIAGPQATAEQTTQHLVKSLLIAP
ncbi:MAG: tRNA (adenosine(37)-N6)-dimethylallyltransferase MiaA [Phycisphaerales bacterium]|nr:tRNA (adenosine(37)-N6)-dimethylallyltransferase MiaA [Phycisphaerales bacterium]